MEALLVAILFQPVLYFVSLASAAYAAYQLGREHEAEAREQSKT